MYFVAKSSTYSKFETRLKSLMIINRSDLGVGINVTWIEEFIKEYILVAILLVYQHVQKQKQNKTNTNHFVEEVRNI